MLARKHFLLLAVLLLVLGSLPIAAQDEAVTMTMWVRNIGDQVQELVDAWNDRGGDQIQLTVIPPNEFVTKMGAAIAAGESPDIASIDLIYAPAFAAAGQLLDITDWVDALPYADDLIPAHSELGTYLGRKYAVPFLIEGSFIIYNKGLFAAAGLDPEVPPTTWDELLEAARAITAIDDETYGYYFAGACSGCNAFTYLPFIWASGGDVLSDDYSEATIATDPIVREALEYYRLMWEEGLIPEGASIDDGSSFVSAFGTGTIGMAGTGAFGINVYRNDHPELSLGAFHIPGKDGGAASFGGGDVIAIGSGTQYPDEAWAFLEWMMSDETQLELYAARNRTTVRVSMLENEYSQDDPLVLTAASALAVGHSPYTLVYNDLFNDPNGPWLEMIQIAILDGDIDGALQLGQERFTQIMGG